MNRKQNYVASLMLAGACLLTHSYVALAGEKSYFHSGSWEIVLTTGDADEQRPFCETRSTSWAARRIAFRSTLQAVDALGTSVHLYKAGWKLPANQSTTVTINPVMYPPQPRLTMKVTSAETMIADEWDMPSGLMLGVTVKAITNGANPIALQVSFEGNEEPWVVPALNQFDAYVAARATEQCANDLIAMGPDFYGLPSGTEDSATSPFGSADAARPSDRMPLAAPSQVTPAPATPIKGTWTFSTSEEDWGPTCYLETQNGSVKVGFMAAPGKDVMGYVEGLFEGETRAAWRVDYGTPHMSDGGPSDYSGWHEFGQLPASILDEAAGGRELTVTDRTGKRVALSLDGASNAVPQFKQCHAGTASAPRADKQASTRPEAKKTFSACLLQVKGKTPIKGPCTWAPYGNDDSSMVMQADGYFAILYKEDDASGGGYWNGERNASHAHDPLGDLKKTGDCWTNKTVKMCVKD